MIVAGLVVYLATVGMEAADKVASSVGAVLALIALGAPYLLPSAGMGSMPDPNRVEDSGRAEATGGGKANTGLQALGGDGPAQVTGSGDATADGRGSVANTGIQRERRP